jgi:DHA3 family macrolide efflux protein-like MFS transporter
MMLAIASLLGLGTQVLLTPIAGVYADRWNRKTIIAISDMCQAGATAVLIGMFTLGIADLDPILTLNSILALLTVRGIFQAFHGPTVSAVVPSMVPRDQLSRMNSIDYLFNGIMVLIGPAIGATLLLFMQLGQILWIDVITFIIPVIPLIFIKIPKVSQKPKEEKPSFYQDFRAGIKTLRSIGGMVPLVFLAMALNFLLVPLSTQLPFYVLVDLIGDKPDLAIVMAAIQAGIIIGSISMTLKKTIKNKGLLMLIALYAVFAGYTIVALMPMYAPFVGYTILVDMPFGDFLIMSIGMLIIGVSVPIVNIMLATTNQSRIPLDMQGRVGGVLRALASAISPIGMIFSGFAGLLIGIAPMYLLCAATGFIVISITWVKTDVRKVVEIPPPQQNGEQTLSDEPLIVEKKEEE